MPMVPAALEKAMEAAALSVLLKEHASDIAAVGNSDAQKVQAKAIAATAKVIIAEVLKATIIVTPGGTSTPAAPGAPVTIITPQTAVIS